MVDVMRTKIKRAVTFARQDRDTNVRTLIIGGGVAANSALREAVAELGEKLDLSVRIPAMEYCTDNAAMVAGLACNLLSSGKIADLELAATATVRR